MNAMVRLLGFYELAKHKLKRPIGTIFPFLGNVTGLQMLGEFLARICETGIAAMVFPAHGVENFMFIPSGKFVNGFRISGKVNHLFAEECFVLVLQKEKYLDSGNYIALRIKYDGHVVELYHIAVTASKPIHITDFHLDVLDSHIHVLERALRVVTEETEEVMQYKLRESADVN